MKKSKTIYVDREAFEWLVWWAKSSNGDSICKTVTDTADRYLLAADILDAESRWKKSD